MIKRRSYKKRSSRRSKDNLRTRTKRTSRKSQKRSRRSRKRSRQFGKREKKPNSAKQLTKKLESTDTSFNLLSQFLSPTEVLKVFIFAQKFSKKALENSRPDESIELSIGEKIQLLGVRWYRSRINELIDNLTPEQIILITQGHYNNELRDLILWHKKPDPVDPERITGFKNTLKLFVLKSFLGKSLVQDIKTFLRSLSDKQLVLVANGYVDLGSAATEALAETEYPETKKELNTEAEALEKEEKEVKEEV